MVSVSAKHRNFSFAKLKLFQHKTTTRILVLFLGLVGCIYVVDVVREQHALRQHYGPESATTTFATTTNSAASCPLSPQQELINANYQHKLSGSSTTSRYNERNDPELHKTSTVMAMGTKYNLDVYQNYVGSLRNTGFGGNIILVVSPDISNSSESYLLAQNVTLHKVQYVECDHFIAKDNSKEMQKKDKATQEILTCVHPYPKLKNRWARFPLLRDLLLDCGGDPNPDIQCGGPVLISDMRDTFFQRNPFCSEAPRVQGLQVFEEHYSIRTTHWLAEWPIKDCKGVKYDEPMLCSGTTIGTRQAMLDYLNIFHQEMNVWMEDPKCNNFKINGDDQSMHNYLYYSGMLENVTGGVVAVKNRNGIVHTAGAMGSLVLNSFRKQKKIWGEELQKNTNDTDKMRLQKTGAKELENTVFTPLSKGFNWLNMAYGLTDEEGYFVDIDGSRSFVVHQFDRFGGSLNIWMRVKRMQQGR